MAVELAFWDSIRASTDPADFEAYLNRYPNGQFAALARNRLAAPARSGAASSEATAADSFRVTSITDQARREGMAGAPALITADGLACQLSDARFIGQKQDPKTEAITRFYELACVNALGYLVVDNGRAQAPSWMTCADMTKADADGKPNAAACFLPGNLDDKRQLQPFADAAKAPCDMTHVRGLGHNEQSTYFEVACSNGRGYVLKTSAPPRLDQPVQMIPCLAFNPPGPIACKLSEPSAQLAAIDSLAAQSGKNCQVKNRRYIVSAPDASNYYEVSCADGAGWVLQELPDGQLGQVIGCDAAGSIAGGCTLTSASASQSERIGRYTMFAHSAGYACDVSKYAAFPAAPPGYDEAVELVCSNRPDGAVALFASAGSRPATVYNCALSELAGYRCSFTQADAAFPQLTNDLARLGKTSCAVSGERIVGIYEAKAGYIEVACAM